ncbi:MAG TPA: DUF971 domain-containing protein [Phototrophicaceae bacterium]|jgi:DUF971 family protein|nr:DUF971 domain-containing protein [Phototrophicaceae bacterium]
MQQKVMPAGITLNKTEGYLAIQWSDGATCQYPLDHLREACPCVECRGGHANMGREFDPENILKLVPRRSYKMTELNRVGSYALQPVWDDGHSTGIYTWDYLRRLCPPDQS